MVTPPMATAGRARRKTVPAALALAVLFFLGLSGCATTDGEILPEGDRPIVTERPAGTVTDDLLPITIDPGVLDPSEVESVLVLVFHVRGQVTAEAQAQPRAQNDAPTAEFNVKPTVLPAAQDGRAAHDRQNRQLTLELPVQGLEDGETYRYRMYLVLTGGNRYLVDPELEIHFAVGLPIPTIFDGSGEIVRTFDPRPTFRWSLPDGTPPVAVRMEAISSPDGRELFAADVDSGILSAAPPDNLVTAQEITAGRDIRWRARTISSRGLNGPWSGFGQIRFMEELAFPQPLTGYAGMPSVLGLPGLVWNGPAGSTAYDVEIIPAGEADGLPGSDGAAVRRRVTTSRYSMTTADLERLIDGYTGGSPRPVSREPAATSGMAAPARPQISWRVVAENSLGNRTPPSPWFTFTYDHRMSAMETVIPFEAMSADTLPVVILGTDPPRTQETFAQDDETPPLPVQLSRSYTMSRYEITNDAAAGAFNNALRRGDVVFSSDTDTDATARRDLVFADGNYRLLAFGQLDFGTQFSLQVTEDNTIEPVPGYRSHPVIGISWYGAVVLANELSLLAGRDQVYEISADGIATHPDRDGYRLPTEAEWAFAAALDRRVQRDTRDAPAPRIREDRPLGPIELRGSNYQRSGHRWEDLAPPFTRAGGPTTPVGALGYFNPAGLADMVGNVWEWTADWYDPDWYANGGPGSQSATPTVAVPDGGPPAPVPDIYNRELRVVRGCAWNTPRENLRRTNRGAFSPDATSHSIGVRLVRTLIPNSP